MPLIGDFAVGLLFTSVTDWGIETHRDDRVIDGELKTPKGGIYVWYRNW